VGGTTKRSEYLPGDFCKHGDGGTDIEPLAHLYKNQVYQCTRLLGGGVIPQIICCAPHPRALRKLCSLGLFQV